MGILRLQQICYEDKDKKILDHISFEVSEGDCISIVGTSGSGKSTLLKICASLLEASKGDLIYREKNYDTYEPTDLRKKISYCVQTPCLFGDTVYDNLVFPYKIRHKELEKDKVINLLQRFNLDESYIDKKVSILSGGEKQRIALIRNLVFTPDILLLDEVTSALDEDNAKIIEAYIKELNESGVTILWITHNQEQSEGIFSKRLVISDGQVERMEELQ